MKDVIFPRLVPLLRQAYQAAQGNEEQKAKVMKVIMGRNPRLRATFVHRLFFLRERLLRQQG